MEQCICSTQKKVCKKSAHCQNPQKSQIVSAETPHNALQLNAYLCRSSATRLLSYIYRQYPEKEKKRKEFERKNIRFHAKVSQLQEHKKIIPLMHIRSAVVVRLNILSIFLLVVRVKMESSTANPYIPQKSFNETVQNYFCCNMGMLTSMIMEAVRGQ